MSNSNAIRHSLDRLKKARDALKRIERNETLEDVASAWSDLLINGNAVYSKLEQGSKANGRAAAWFGRAKGSEKMTRFSPICTTPETPRSTAQRT
jgi:hypothetical protein